MDHFCSKTHFFTSKNSNRSDYLKYIGTAYSQLCRVKLQKMVISLFGTESLLSDNLPLFSDKLPKTMKYNAKCLFQSVTKMIQEACTYVEKTPNLDIKLKLIDTLRTVTAGKVSYRMKDNYGIQNYSACKEFSSQTYTLSFSPLAVNFEDR